MTLNVYDKIKNGIVQEFLCEKQFYFKQKNTTLKNLHLLYP